MPIDAPGGYAATRIAPRSGSKIMRIAARAIIVTTGVVGLIGSALAAEMTGADLKAFLSGKIVPLFPPGYLYNHENQPCMACT